MIHPEYPVLNTCSSALRCYAPSGFAILNWIHSMCYILYIFANIYPGTCKMEFNLVKQAYTLYIQGGIQSSFGHVQLVSSHMTICLEATVTPPRNYHSTQPSLHPARGGYQGSLRSGHLPQSVVVLFSMLGPLHDQELGIQLEHEWGWARQDRATATTLSIVPSPQSPICVVKMEL